MSTIGTRIKKAREALGMSQAVLASSLGKSQVTVSGWENDRHVPRMPDLEAIARVLGTNSSNLLSGPDRAGQSAPLTIAVVPVIKDLLAENPFSASNVVGYVPFPPESDPRGVFAHVLETDDLEDFESAASLSRGDIVYLRPHMPVTKGVCVIAYVSGRPESDHFALDPFYVRDSTTPANRRIIAPVVGFYRPL